MNFFLLLEDIIPFCGATDPYLGLLVTSALEFKCSVDPPLACFLTRLQWFLRFTSGMTPLDGSQAFFDLHTYTCIFKHWWDSNPGSSVQHSVKFKYQGHLVQVKVIQEENYILVSSYMLAKSLNKRKSWKEIKSSDPFYQPSITGLTNLFIKATVQCIVGIRSWENFHLTKGLGTWNPVCMVQGLTFQPLIYSKVKCGIEGLIRSLCENRVVGLSRL